MPTSPTALVDDRHLPRQTPIEAHGGGGFRFADLSHRGSLLCLPDGMWAWPVAAPADITDATLALVFARVSNSRFFHSRRRRPRRGPLPAALRAKFHDAHVSIDAMMTGPAVRTYNVMQMEGRRVGAGLIASNDVDLDLPMSLSENRLPTFPGHALGCGMQDAFAYCAELVREADRDRYLASLFAPAEHPAARCMRFMLSISK